MTALPPELRPETGPKKEPPPQFRRSLVDYYTKESAGTIIVDTPNTYLYLVLGNGKALRYGIGVGREGFTWAGAERVSRMAEWPDWNPPETMISASPICRASWPVETATRSARAPSTSARLSTAFTAPISRRPSEPSYSSGCIRLTNEDITDLYARVKVGTRVVVLPGAGADCCGGAVEPPRGIIAVTPSG